MITSHRHADSFSRVLSSAHKAGMVKPIEEGLTLQFYLEFCCLLKGETDKQRNLKKTRMKGALALAKIEDLDFRPL